MEKNTSEIAKLTERIAKDPKSKLFVPLAEEHKKAGNMEMAIHVLEEGLRNNPSYVTARSFLGRLLMELGDLAGAQKELEEVIKAIPDNLLAQRKLADIYVIQGRAGDAMQRYKAALALNPGDKDIPSLLADLEAGKDISDRIPRPKVQSPPPAVKPPQTPAGPGQPKTPAAAAAKPAPNSPVSAAKAPAASPQSPVKQAASTQSAAPATVNMTPAKSASPARAAASVAAPAKMQPVPAPAPAAPSRDEPEVIEDIVDIESIEHPVAAPEVKKPALEAPSAPPADKSPATEALSFDLSEAPVIAPETAVEKAVPAWGAAEPMTAVANAPAAATPEEAGDDLNTNTLAELYISQGFYDKAIEVYQGMLNDRPQNRALQQKIMQLKGMAGAQEAASQRSTALSSGPGEFIPPPADVANGATAAPPRAGIPVPAQEAAAAPAASEPAPADPGPRGSRTASVRRKETIDRLESWLKNIIKEKP